MDNNKLNLKENLQDKFVAFIDVMGFSNLVNSDKTENLEAYFLKITDEIDKIKVEKEIIQSFLISDSIILISPTGVNGFRQLVIAVRRIQSALLWRGILLRGAVTHGKIYYNSDKNIVVGKGFIRAYLLEQEAIFPRIIIDPKIINLFDCDRQEFLRLVNKSKEYNFEERLVYTKSEFSSISEDSIFIDYANKTIKRKLLNGNINNIYETIAKNLYSEQKLFSKYIWLKNYFLECLRLTNKLITNATDVKEAHKKNLSDWITKFERL